MKKSKNSPISYADSGVDIAAGNSFVERIKPAVRATERPGVAGELGGFGGLFDLAACGFRDPVLVSATDGVGTKLRLAIESGVHDSVGVDLVAMCVNDIIVQGAEPLFFLDYFATAKLELEVASSVVAGIAEGCRQAGAALIGGETAEMPDMYAANDYDLAGFCVGAVEREKIIDGSSIAPGDAIIGLASSGVHSNGFSLVRRILANAKQRNTPGLPAIEEALLVPTRIYVKSILQVLSKFKLKGIAHITGGGITENLPRILPSHCDAQIDLNAWRLPAIFDWLMSEGPVIEAEMLKTFNCGIGLIVVVSSQEATGLQSALNALGEQACLMGSIAEGDRRVKYNGSLAD